jgi:hypothetical protein
MKHQIRVVAAASFVVVGAAMSAAQSAKPASTRIPECDKYAAMVASCLPKMCEADRVVAEMELEIHREMLPAQIQHHGRDAAAKTCATQIEEAVRDDVSGCYAMAPMRAIRVDKVQPTGTGLIMTLSGTGTTSVPGASVALLTVPGEPPTAVYRLPEWNGQYVLDTTSAPSAGAGRGAPQGPVRLDPATTYCFVIESTAGNRNEIHRRGTFTTLPKR